MAFLCPVLTVLGFHSKIRLGSCGRESQSVLIIAEIIPATIVTTKPLKETIFHFVDNFPGREMLCIPSAGFFLNFRNMLRKCFEQH